MQWNYLRVRGEYLCVRLRAARKLELPPRARRILSRWCQPTLGRGTTSACAENTCWMRYLPCWPGNYLRVRGEYCRRSGRIGRGMELPPRARRIQLSTSTGSYIGGTTSACAENTVATPIDTPHYGNYLRVRGEYGAVNQAKALEAELPPRARRIPRPGVSWAPDFRTTSACAENTSGILGQAYAIRNYLRVRGEYWHYPPLPKHAAELPPRARRIHRSRLGGGLRSGTTSACAENT